MVPPETDTFGRFAAFVRRAAPTDQLTGRLGTGSAAITLRSSAGGQQKGKM